ncbi:MAG: transporter substrate-binding domain-containing protein [Nocardioides sp.]
MALAGCGGDGTGSDGVGLRRRGHLRQHGRLGRPARRHLRPRRGIVVSTDPKYPPQSFLNSDTGEYEGFDIDVAAEIAKRLGVDIGWEAPSGRSAHRRRHGRAAGT